MAPFRSDSPSFHLNPSAKKGMLTAEGIAYLKKYQPIGCRDYYTQKLLETYGIETYFSACLTLSLNRGEYVEKNQKREGDLCDQPYGTYEPRKGSCSKGVVKKRHSSVKKTSKRKHYSKSMKRLQNFLVHQSEAVHYSSQLRDPIVFSEEARIEEAKQQLKAIANAHLVITSRIHTALPAVAFGTPVLFLSDGLGRPNQKSRLEGMEKFFPILNSRNLDQWKSKFPEPTQVHQSYVEQFKKEITRFLNE